jgi:hypothetical protein
MRWPVQVSRVAPHKSIDSQFANTSNGRDRGAGVGPRCQEDDVLYEPSAA